MIKMCTHDRLNLLETVKIVISIEVSAGFSGSRLKTLFKFFSLVFIVIIKMLCTIFDSIFTN